MIVKLDERLASRQNITHLSRFTNDHQTKDQRPKTTRPKTKDQRPKTTRRKTKDE